MNQIITLAKLKKPRLTLWERCRLLFTKSDFCHDEKDGHVCIIEFKHFDGRFYIMKEWHMKQGGQIARHLLENRLGHRPHDKAKTEFRGIPVTWEIKRKLNAMIRAGLPEAEVERIMRKMKETLDESAKNLQQTPKPQQKKRGSEGTDGK